MSIFKETFPKFIREQLKKREEILSSGIDPQTGEQNGSRSDNFYTYTLNKQCILRMSSGVDLKEDFSINELTGKSLAARNVLQGGIQWNDIDTKSGGLSKPAEGGGFDGAYGSTSMFSDSEDGYGIVPMPGIIDAQIRTKSAYGSLREAKVKFECHNKRQLEVLEILYMRPGYHLLLEWQWSPYIDNEGTINYDANFNNSFFNENSTMISLEKDILKTKKDTGGNYDALMGYCKNFTYTSRPDGGYTCETQIIAKGEVLESIKEVGDYRDKNGKKASNAGDQPALETLLKNLKEYHNPASNPELTNPYNSKKDQESQKVMLWYLGIENQANNNSVHPFVLPKNTAHIQYKLFAAQADVCEINERLGTHKSFVRWDAFCNALNKLAPKGESGHPLYEFHTYQIDNEHEDGDEIEISPLRYNDGYNFILETPYNLGTESPTPKGDKKKSDPLEGDYIDPFSIDCSADPHVCILAHQFLGLENFSIFSKLGATKTVSDLTSGGQFEKLTHNDQYNLAGSRHTKYTSTSQLTVKEKSHRYAIGGIYLNPTFMLEKFREAYYDSNGNASKDYSLFKFIEAVWDGVNSCTEHHNFKLNTENRPEGNIVRIIDLMNVNGNNIEDGNLEDIYELKIFSPDSTVRDVSYNTTLPSALAATIAISAQAPDSVDDLDKVTFGALNKNTTDRFNSTNVSELPSDEVKDKWNARFDEALEDYAMGLFVPVGEAGSRSGTLVRPGGLLYLHTRFDFLSETYNTNNKGEDSEEKNTQATDTLSLVNKSQVKVSKAINILRNSYASDSDSATSPKYYRGQIVNTSPNQSSIIPLKFNAKMDGVGGIVIGNVFKLPKDKLPIGYQGDDIYFIVMAEEQKITSGQDWTTTISGHLILLGGNANVPQGLKDSWKKGTANLTYNSQYMYSTYTTKDGKETSANQQQEQGTTSGGNDQTDHGAKNTTIECTRLIKGNKALHEACKSRDGTYKDSNISRKKPRHELPTLETCETITSNEVMVKLTALLIKDGINKFLAPKIAAGFCGNIKHESSYGASRYGDKGNAVGLCQWNGTRFDRLVSQYPNSWWTADSQISHILYELKNKESTAYKWLKLCNNPKDCALIIVNRFERPQSYLDKFYLPQYYTIEGHTGKEFQDGPSPNAGKGMTLSDSSASARANSAQNAYNIYVDANSGYKDETSARKTIKAKMVQYFALKDLKIKEILKEKGVDAVGTTLKVWTSNYHYTLDGKYTTSNGDKNVYIRVKGSSREDSAIFMDALPEGSNYSNNVRLTDTNNLSYIHFVYSEDSSAMMALPLVSDTIPTFQYQIGNIAEDAT